MICADGHVDAIDLYLMRESLNKETISINVALIEYTEKKITRCDLHVTFWLDLLHFFQHTKNGLDLNLQIHIKYTLHFHKQKFRMRWLIL